MGHGIHLCGFDLEPPFGHGLFERAGCYITQGHKMTDAINKTGPAAAAASKDAKILALVFVMAILFLSQGLNAHGVGFRDDEIFYFKSTQEMLSSGNFLSPTYLGEYRFQKPILFYWLILAAY